MPQILVKSEDIKGSQFTLTGSEAHHVIRVLRKDVDDTIDLFDGQGSSYKARITHVHSDGQTLAGEIIETNASSVSPIQIHLFQGLPKGAKFDYVIEKASELGVHAITPFLSEKNIIKLDHKQKKTKLERWEKLAVASAKQCGRSEVTKITSPEKLTDLEGLFKKNKTLVCGLSNAKPLKGVVKNIKNSPSIIQVVVGPESGFSESEMAWFKGLQTNIVSLGSNTLRTETAGLALASILKYEFDLF